MADYGLMLATIAILVVLVVAGVLERRGNAAAKRILDFLFGPKVGKD